MADLLDHPLRIPTRRFGCQVVGYIPTEMREAEMEHLASSWIRTDALNGGFRMDRPGRVFADKTGGDSMIQLQVDGVERARHATRTTRAGERRAKERSRAREKRGGTPIPAATARRVGRGIPRRTRAMRRTR